MTTEYERLKAWLKSLGISTVSQSVTIQNGIAVVEEDVDLPPETAVLLSDVYDVLGLRDAPWLIEEDIGNRRIMKSPVGVWRKL